VQTKHSYRGLSAVPMIYFKAMVLEKTMDLPEWFDIAKELELDATEIHDKSLRSRDEAYIDDIAQQLEHRGLKVSQVVGAADLTNPNPDIRESELATTFNNIDIAARLGATCVRITAGQAHDALSHEQGVKLAVEGIKRAVEYATSKNVWVAYENHYKDYFWEKPDFSQRSEVFLEILSRLHDVPIKVNFDCSNQVMIGEDPVNLLRQVVDYVIHVHCSDRVAPNQYLHAVTGEGIVDYRSIFGILKQHGYSSWLSVEYNGTEGLEGLRRSINNVRRLWQEA